jgi:deoxyribonuclease-1
MHYIVFILMIFLSFAACGKPIVDKTELQNEIRVTHSRVLDYAEARAYLFGKLHYNNGIVTDVYCEQNYDARHGVGPGKIPDPKFLNCEHTWPQSMFFGPEAASMKTDLHHLFPSNSNSNSTRSNHPFGEVSNGPNVCNISSIGKIVNTNLTGFEPPQRHKGNVARAIFYFSTRYAMPLDPVQEHYLRQWHKQDPIDQEEVNRNLMIQQIQGNLNPFIIHPEYVETIKDF